MSFFEPPPPPPPRSLAEAEYRQPVWLGPPANVVPGVVPVLLIARTDQTAVAVIGICAYPTGFGFTLSLRVRRRSARQQQLFSPLDAAFEANQIPDDFLRFGVQFADGGKATNLPRYDLHHDDTEPDPPVLTAHGGGGGGLAWDMEQWVWPLPPAGPLAFVCEWPARQIGESRVELDARLVLQAAERAATLWPDDEPPFPGTRPRRIVRRDSSKRLVTRDAVARSAHCLNRST